MSNATVAQQIKSTDELISQFEAKTISAVESSMDAAFRRLEREFRRKWVEVEGLDISGQNRAILLLEQIKNYLEILPGDSANIDKLYEDLVTDCQVAGVDFGASAIESITGFAAATVKPNLKAVAYQSQDASKRLHRHSTDFQLAASRVIEQGLVGGSGVAKVAEQLRRELGVTKSKAETIARTESMSAMDSATRDTYRKNGIEYVQRIGTQDDRICPICAARVGNVYPVDKAVGVIHPRDRCWCAPFSPAWVEMGLVDMEWLQNHRAESIAALGDKSPDYGPSPFERMAGQLPIKPTWTVDRGFAAGFESILGIVSKADAGKPSRVIPGSSRSSLQGETQDKVRVAQSENQDNSEISSDGGFADLIKRGSPLTDQLAKDLAATSAKIESLQARKSKASAAFDKKIDELDGDFSAAFKTKESRDSDAADKALKDAEAAQVSAMVEAMRKLREDLIQSGEPPSKIPKITKKATINLGEPEISQAFEDFARIAGGRGVKLIKKITRDDDRATADPDTGVLNIGKNADAKTAAETLWHEMAHFIEFEDSAVGDAAIEWVKSRATGKIQKLNELGPDTYDDDEVARPDKFVSPYVGKVYDGESFTEVISMGFEHFYSPETMAKLYIADPDHFNLILGVIKK